MMLLKRLFRWCRSESLNTAFLIALALAVFVLPWLVTCSF
jgi:hypothetical protein